MSPLDPALFPAHAACAFVFGSMFGSFFNVVIWRSPRRFSTVLPGSHCPSCGTPIRWHDNIPILSWLMLDRRCRHCGVTISWRYAGVEMLTALLFLAVFWEFRWSGVTVVYAVFVSLLIVATFTDIDHWIIPDGVTYGGLVFGFAAASVAPWLGPDCILTGDWHPWAGRLWQGAAVAAVGAAAGWGLLMGIAVGGRLLFRKEAMGMGDVWLMAMFGTFLAWQGVIATLVIACFAGAVIGGVLLFFDRLREQRSGGPLPPVPAELPEGLDPSTPDGFGRAVEHLDLHRRERRVSSHLPFGPYLCLGALLTLFFWDEIIGTLWTIYIGPAASLAGAEGPMMP